MDGVGLEQTEFRPGVNCDTAINTQGKNLIDSIVGKTYEYWTDVHLGTPSGTSLPLKMDTILQMIMELWMNAYFRKLISF